MCTCTYGKNGKSVLAVSCNNPWFIRCRSTNCYFFHDCCPPPHFRNVNSLTHCVTVSTFVSMRLLYGCVATRRMQATFSETEIKMMYTWGESCNFLLKETNCGLLGLPSGFSSPTNSPPTPPIHPHMKKPLGVWTNEGHYLAGWWATMHTSVVDQKSWFRSDGHVTLGMAWWLGKLRFPPHSWCWFSKRKKLGNFSPCPWFPGPVQAPAHAPSPASCNQLFEVI